MYIKKKLNKDKIGNEVSVDILPPYSQNGTDPSFCARYGGLKLYLYSNRDTIWSQYTVDSRTTTTADTTSSGRRNGDMFPNSWTTTTCNKRSRPDSVSTLSLYAPVIRNSKLLFAGQSH